MADASDVGAFDDQDGAQAGIGAGPQNEIPDELFEALGLSREKAEDAVSKVLSAEVALRELAAQFQQPH